MRKTNKVAKVIECVQSSVKYSASEAEQQQGVTVGRLTYE